jgi:hypothetical protein
MLGIAPFAFGLDHSIFAVDKIEIPSSSLNVTTSQYGMATPTARGAP